MNSRFIKKETAIGLLIIIILFSFIIHSFAQHNFDLNNLKDYINSFGIWTPLILLLIIIITSSIGLIFSIPVAIAALLLGIYGAFFISIIGLTIGAAISFIIARYLGRDYLEKKYIHKIKKLDEYDKKLQKNGFLVIFYLRLISLVPYELINIFAGLSRVKFSTFIFATLLGIIPGTMITIYLVDSTKNLFSLQFNLAILVHIIFFLIPLLSKRVRHFVFNRDNP
ncbi:MAG: TVP38/TMEM64 family protein [Nanoarchaeota archaeon]